MNANPLLEAIQADDLTAIAMALQEGVTRVLEVDENGQSALHLAAARGQSEIAQHLIAAGADVNLVDRQHGATPLHWAAMHAHHRVVSLLLKAGADPNICDHDGNTALRYALDGFAGTLVPWGDCVNPKRFYGSICMMLLQDALSG